MDRRPAPRSPCVLLGGAGLGYYLYVQGTVARHPRLLDGRVHRRREPAPTDHAAAEAAAEAAAVAALTRVDWPTYGYDARRLRYLPSRLQPPFRVQWTFRARHLLEFPPAVAYGRAYIANNPGVLYAVQAATGRASWRYTSGRCAAASPAVADGVVYMAFLNSRRTGSDACNAQPGTPGLDGEVVALDARTGKVVWRHMIGPSETSPLVADGRVYVGDWTGRVYALSAKTGREVWDYQTGGAGEGRGRAHRPPALRRLLRPPPLRARRAQREADLALLLAGPARRPRHVLLDPGDRVRARLHRLDRRQGLLVRRVERRAALVAVDRRLRLRLAGGVGTSRS